MKEEKIQEPAAPSTKKDEAAPVVAAATATNKAPKRGSLKAPPKTPSEKKRQSMVAPNVSKEAISPAVAG